MHTVWFLTYMLMYMYMHIHFSNLYVHYLIYMCIVASQMSNIVLDVSNYFSILFETKVTRIYLLELSSALASGWQLMVGDPFPHSCLNTQLLSPSSLPPSTHFLFALLWFKSFGTIHMSVFTYSALPTEAGWKKFL